MRKRIDHDCTVVPEKFSFPTGILGPRDGNLLSSLNTNYGFYLPRIPVSACGKDKKRTDARGQHTGRTSIHDVIIILKVRHHVASQRIQDFPEVFFMFFQYKMRYLVVSKK